MDKKLGEFLEELRGNLSLREASKKSGLSHSYIRDIELGLNRANKTPITPSPDVLKRLANAYKYPYNDLLKRAGHLEEEYNAKSDWPNDKILDDQNIRYNEVRMKLERIMLSGDQATIDAALSYLEYLANRAKI